MSEIKRSIKFYRFDLGMKKTKPVELDIPALSSAIAKLKGSQRVSNGADGVQHICTPISTNNPHRLRFLRVKNTDLPKIVDKNYKEEDLESGKGIGEAVHIVLFPDNIVGVEYNKNGTSIYWINDYFSTKVPSLCEDMKYSQLIWPDKLKQLLNMEILLQVDIKVRRGFHVQAQQISDEEGSIKQAFDTLENIENMGEMSLTLTAEDARKRQDIVGLGSGMYKAVRQFIKQGHSMGGLEKLKIRGINKQTSTREEVNILDGLLIIKKNVIKMDKNTKTLVSKDMWEKIEEAYEEHKAEIKKAGEIVFNELVLE